MDKRITIAQRQRPFSHKPGTKTTIPGSSLIATVFPCLLEIGDQKFPIPLTGPVKDFTVMLDLEGGFVKVWGHYQEGFLRYRIHSTLSGGFSIIVEKSPKEDLFPVNSDPIYQMPPVERLFLGCNKAQDWDQVKTRNDPAEIYPFWHRLGQLVPHNTTKITSLMNAFNAHFDGIMAPRLLDTDHQGLELTQNSQALLSEGYRQIRSLFIRDFEMLSSKFPVGRLIGVCTEYGTLDIEWTKGALRRMVFHATSNEEVLFTFPKELKRFRVCLKKNQKGKIYTCGTPIAFESGQSYLLDHFQK